MCPSSPVNGSSDGKACSGGSEDPGDSSQMKGTEEAGQVNIVAALQCLPMLTCLSTHHQPPHGFKVFWHPPPSPLAWISSKGVLVIILWIILPNSSPGFSAQSNSHRSLLVSRYHPPLLMCVSLHFNWIQLSSALCLSKISFYVYFSLK